MKDIYRIVHLYRQFNKYEKITYGDLIKHLLPSINLDQYQIHRVNGIDVGFTNWAFLSDTVEQRFKITGKLKANEWNSGNNIWVIDIVAKSNVREIMKWVKEYFKPQLEVNEPVKWVRMGDDFSIYRRSEKYKREFHI
jgi:hemolysin-activating ACP:hemolysin acyltransferase